MAICKKCNRNSGATSYHKDDSGILVYSITCVLCGTYEDAILRSYKTRDLGITPGSTFRRRPCVVSECRETVTDRSKTGMCQKCSARKNAYEGRKHPGNPPFITVSGVIHKNPLYKPRNRKNV